MRSRFLFLTAALLLVVGLGWAFLRGTGPLPDPEGCTARAAGRAVFLDIDQAENATLISAIAIKRGLPARAVSIALATAYQESKIRNLGHGDRDSLGIFQQRPSQGWGTPKQIQDPIYSINKFYDALEKVSDYQSKRITVAAQEVQRSGFPEAYEQHAPDARALASALTGYSSGGKFSCVVQKGSGNTRISRTIELLDDAYGTSIRIVREAEKREISVQAAQPDPDNRLGWSVAQFLIAHAKAQNIKSVSYAGLTWTSGRASENGWVGTPAPDEVVTVIFD
jgi:hypothetical protein